ADDRHVAAAGDAVAQDAGDLRHARVRQQAVDLEDVAGSRSAGEAATLLGQEQPAAVDQIDGRDLELQSHLLRTLELLGRLGPPRGGSNRGVVGDQHAQPSFDANEGGDDPGGGGTERAELLTVVDERPDLVNRATWIAEQIDAFARGEFALL